MARKHDLSPTPGTRHGNGLGWGGPAKGARPTNSAPPITTENAAEFRRRQLGDPLVAARREEREAVTAMLHGRMYDIAMDPTLPAQGCIAAAVALDNRLNGMPVARTVNVNADAAEGMTPDERRARIDELHRFVTGGGGSGAAAPADGGTPPSVPD